MPLRSMSGRTGNPFCLSVEKECGPGVGGGERGVVENQVVCEKRL